MVSTLICCFTVDETNSCNSMLTHNVGKSSKVDASIKKRSEELCYQKYKKKLFKDW